VDLTFSRVLAFAGIRSSSEASAAWLMFMTSENGLASLADLAVVIDPYRLEDRLIHQASDVGFGSQVEIVEVVLGNYVSRARTAVLNMRLYVNEMDLFEFHEIHSGVFPANGGLSKVSQVASPR
jgi:hypothetical protein